MISNHFEKNEYFFIYVYKNFTLGFFVAFDNSFTNSKED